MKLIIFINWSQVSFQTLYVLTNVLQNEEEHFQCWIDLSNYRYWCIRFILSDSIQDRFQNLLNEYNSSNEKKLAILLELTKEYGFVSPETGINYGESALQLSRMKEDIISELMALRYLGVSYHYLNE